MKSRFMIAALLSVVLAVGAPLASALLQAKQFRDYPSFRVDIEPYDPRDLFYGHYLQFQTAWNWKEKNTPPQDRVWHPERFACLCVGEETISPQVSLAACPAEGETLKECRFTLRGKQQGNSRFDNGVHRYYVDETLAKPLETLFIRDKKRFSLDLHVTPEGKTLPGELYIEGEKWKDYIVRHGGEISQSKKP